MPQLLAPVGAGPQEPTPLPTMVHTPLQQSPFCTQMSPCWAHHVDGWQVPPAHRPEQQSPLALHELPSDAHAPDSAAHLPPLHWKVQHWSLALHAPPLETHAG
jgi:hypothetical protein